MRNENLKRIKEIAIAFKLMLIAVCIYSDSELLLKLMLYREPALPPVEIRRDPPFAFGKIIENVRSSAIKRIGRELCLNLLKLANKSFTSSVLDPCGKFN